MPDMNPSPLAARIASWHRCIRITVRVCYRMESYIAMVFNMFDALSHRVVSAISSRSLRLSKHAWSMEGSR